jgi:transposase
VGAAPDQARSAAAGGAGLCHHHGIAAGAGRLAAQLGRHPGGDGIHLRLLEGVYWLLEAEGFDCWLVNAREVKNVPGRPKTDKADAVWLGKVAERGMCRPSLVQPRPIRQLRDLTRYRRPLIQDRTREMQRVEKLLEDAQIKLSSVASDIFGVSGRAMLEALIAGQRDPKALAQLARRRLRAKLAALEEALRGFFTDHHAAILPMMLDNIDRHTEQIAALDTTIEEAVAPLAAQVAQLDEVTGVGLTAAQELIAEVGVDMGRFPFGRAPGVVGQVLPPGP